MERAKAKGVTGNPGGIPNDTGTPDRFRPGSRARFVAESGTKAQLWSESWPIGLTMLDRARAIGGTATAAVQKTGAGEWCELSGYLVEE